MWDGTLDPAAIQSQVKLSLAMTEAAFRAESGAFRGNSEAAPEPLGTHRRSPARARTQAPGEGEAGTSRLLGGEVWKQDTKSFRNFVDTLFTRAEDKEQLTSLFAVTHWQNS